MFVSQCFCDRCGAIVTEGRTAMSVECGAMRAHHASIDLCGPCTQAFQSFLACPADEPFQLSPPQGSRRAATAAAG